MEMLNVAKNIPSIRKQLQVYRDRGVPEIILNEVGRVEFRLADGIGLEDKGYLLVIPSEYLTLYSLVGMMRGAEVTPGLKSIVDTEEVYNDFYVCKELEFKDAHNVTRTSEVTSEFKNLLTLREGVSLAIIMEEEFCYGGHGLLLCFGSRIGENIPCISIAGRWRNMGGCKERIQFRG